MRARQRISAVVKCHLHSVTADLTAELASGLPDSVRCDLEDGIILAHRKSRASSPDSLL
jgi:hypothetical protein